MQNTSEIKQRIKVIKDTKQITKAMYLISSSKLNKSVERYKANINYFEKIRVGLKYILNHSQDIDHLFFQHREGNRAAYIVISSDKGLCGDYNGNILKATLHHMEDKKDRYIFVIGQIAREFFLRQNYKIDVEFLYAAQNPTFFNAREIAEDIIELYKNNMMDEVYVAYTSSINHLPSIIKILPIERTDFDDVAIDSDNTREILFQPSPKTVFDLLVPKYVIGLLYGALVQSYSSEQRARMLAMDAATKNADEMIAKLQLEYNRARQASITNEISEIVAGINAVNNT